MPINICFSCDNRYVQHLCCTIKSLIETNDEEFNIIVLDGGITFENQQYIKSLLNNKSIIEFIKLDNSRFKNCPLTKETFHINSLSTYYRFLLSSICDLDRILYLDCDIIVRKSIKALYDTNVDDYYFAGVKDILYEENCKRLSLEKYCNAGVMLINLDLWRKNNIEEKLFKWCIENPDKIKWQDQDVLNVVLQDKIKYLDDIYNTQVAEGDFGLLKYFYNNADNAAIIHYVTCFKPWLFSDFKPNKYYLKHLFTLRGHLLWKLEYFNIINIYKWLNRKRKQYLRVKFGSKEKYIIIFGKTLYEKGINL